MIRRRIFIRHAGAGCSHCQKKIARMRESHRDDDAQFHYRCPVCRTLWCRQIREYGTLEEFAEMGILPTSVEFQDEELKPEDK